MTYVNSYGWPVLAVLWVLLGVAKHLSLKRVVSRLKEVDGAQWAGMNCPEASYFRRFDDYVNTAPISMRAQTVPTEFSELSLWLSECRYEKVNDAILTSAATRYKVLNKVMVAIAVIAVCALFIPKLVARYAAP